MPSPEEKSSEAAGALEGASDRCLARGVRGGEKAAFEELFRRYCDDLCVFAESYVRSTEAAEDLVHDVFFDVWNRRELFRPGGTVRAYLFQAVRNKTYDQLERRRVRREWKAEKKKEATPATSSAFHRHVEYADLEDVVRQAVEGLSERQRVVYRLAKDHDLSYAEIATVLDISPKTVENHMGRALSRLREWLAPFFTSLCVFSALPGFVDVL